MKDLFPPTIEYRSQFKDCKIKTNGAEGHKLKSRQSNLEEFGFLPLFRKYKQCHRCDEVIFYDPSVKSSKGRIVLREKLTGLIHRCPGRRGDEEE